MYETLFTVSVVLENAAVKITDESLELPLTEVFPPENTALLSKLNVKLADARLALNISATATASPSEIQDFIRSYPFEQALLTHASVANRLSNA